jgi:hypothetical protein
MFSPAPSFSDIEESNDEQLIIDEMLQFEISDDVKATFLWDKEGEGETGGADANKESWYIGEEKAKEEEEEEVEEKVEVEMEVEVKEEEVEMEMEEEEEDEEEVVVVKECLRKRKRNAKEVCGQDKAVLRI